MENAVIVERVGETYIVSRRFESLSAAMAGVERLGSVSEGAFGSTSGPVTYDLPPGLVPQDMTWKMLRDHVLATDEDEGAPLNPVSQATGD